MVLSKVRCSEETCRISVAVLMMVVGSALFLILPLYVGAVVTGLGLGDQEAGYLAFSEMAGTSILSATSFFWIRHINWRRASVLSLVCVFVINLLSMGISDYHSLLWVRFFAGMAGGAVIILGIAYLSEAANPERAFGIAIAAEVFLQVVVMLGMPELISDLGVAAIYGLITILAFINLPLAAFRFMDVLVKADDQGCEGSDSANNPVLAPLSGLMGSLLYFVFIGTLWGFIERIGDAAGLTSSAIGNSLAVGLIIGFGGASFAVYLGNRWSAIQSIMLGTVLQVTAVLILLLLDVSLVSFGVAAAVFSFAWNFILPYQMSAVSNIDFSGRFVVTIIAFQAFGEAIGAGLGGGLSEQGGYASLMQVSLVFLILSFLFFAVMPRLLRSPKGTPHSSVMEP